MPAFTGGDSAYAGAARRGPVAAGGADRAADTAPLALRAKRVRRRTICVPGKQIGSPRMDKKPRASNYNGDVMSMNK